MGGSGSSSVLCGPQAAHSQRGNGQNWAPAPRGVRDGGRRGSGRGDRGAPGMTPRGVTGGGGRPAAAAGRLRLLGFGPRSPSHECWGESQARSKERNIPAKPDPISW